MNHSCNDLVPHPRLLETLFAFKRKVSNVYRDILGIHEIDHIAISCITPQKHLLVFSSTPAMEFNLFNSTLWRYDNSYSPHWINLNTHDFWPNLYHQPRYDELYYLKQVKHAYPIGMSMASQIEGQTVIYSLASHQSAAHVQESFANQYHDFYRIGHYCFNLLAPLFHHCDTWMPQEIAP